MMRFLYRLLLYLHPPAFRREFAEEMLWIFDETAGGAPQALLFSDALVSLTRQWLLRSGAWKLLVAGAGGLVQITAGGLGFFLFRHLRDAAPGVVEPRGDSPEMAQLIYIVAWVTGGVLCSVIALVLWAKKFNEKRLRTN